MKKQTTHAKHQNQVRIIGGSCRGRKLSFAPADGLRPTADMVREKLFNWLGQDLTGQTVLDLFAGSGALGLEAASRHASKVVLVENNRQTAQQLRQNIQTLKLERTEVVGNDALFYLQQSPFKFDTVFLDPPYAWQDWQKLFEYLPCCLNDGAYVYLEAGQLPEWPPAFKIHREGKAGMSCFVLLKYHLQDKAE